MAGLFDLRKVMGYDEEKEGGDIWDQANQSRLSYKKKRAVHEYSHSFTCIYNPGTMMDI